MFKAMFKPTFKGQRTNALNQPVHTAVLPPQANPLDSGVVMHTTNQNSLSGDDTMEELTTPEASLSHTELEPETATDYLASDNDLGATSQSTLSGSSFHTTHLQDGDYADSDESQRWQIEATERGTNTVER